MTSAPRNNRGAALAAALVLLVSLTLIAVTMAYRSTMDELMAANQRDAVAAMGLADSGLEHALAKVKEQYPNDPDNLCNDYPITINPAESGAIFVEDPWADSAQGYYVTLSYCSKDGGTGAWLNEDDKRTILRSVGSNNGAERVAEVLLRYVVGGGGSGTWPSFLANDYIEVSDPNLLGDVVHIHSNYRIKVSGAPEICTASGCDPTAPDLAGTISASGLDPAVLAEIIDAYRESRSPSLDADTAALYAWFDPSLAYDVDPSTSPFDGWPVDQWIDNWFANAYDPKTYEAETKNPYPWDVTGYPTTEDASGSAPIDIPHVYPPDYQDYATVELTQDCLVIPGQSHPDVVAGTIPYVEYGDGSTFIDDGGTVLHNENTQGTWYDWSCNTGQIWELKGSKSGLYSAFYYIHGNTKIGTSMDSPWVASIVAEGNIEIGCCLNFDPYYYGDNSGDTVRDNLFLVAGNDIAVFGSPGQVNEGIIAAHGEVKLSGSDSYWQGSVLAESYLWAPGQEVITNTQTPKQLHSINLINSNVWLNGTGVGLGGGDGGEPKWVVAGWRELVY